ncbi:ATP-binding protein [Entomomonas sp. E2T0]|uniref:ATP-binding protein n=1 Tax=Entomomonas sp. E2T0 TaxID=2930213 RepID=UPI0022283B90|nr:ATP-binding protein [Entomomonas sp. E2T0]UYZ82935.1 ATP-binding protein [Entomomonas sp. E2T0]
MKSIQRRLNLGLAGAILMVGLILTQLGILLFDTGLRNYFEHDLQEETEYLVTAVVRNNQAIYVNDDRINPIYTRPYSGRYYVIESGGNIWRSRSLWDFEFLTANQEGLLPKLVAGPNNQRLLTFRADFQKYGYDVKVTIARDYEPILTSFQSIQYWGVVGIVLALLMIVVLQRIVIFKALRPLGQIREEIEQLQRGLRTSLDKEVPVELKPLVEQVNQLLIYTGNQLKRSRNSLGNLGHALKTPLAVLMSVMARPEFDKIPKVKLLMKEQLEAIEQLLVRELNKAKIVGDVLPASYFVCDKELPTLIEVLHMVHNERVALEWHVPEALRLPWNKDDILELLGNLLDNACKWAQGKVRLIITEEADHYQLVIDDDGPGISENQYEEVLSRGVRLDEQTAGHGLGLGIVKDMIESWQGELSLDRSELGGLQVTVVLPKR